MIHRLFIGSPTPAARRRWFLAVRGRRLTGGLPTYPMHVIILVLAFSVSSGVSRKTQEARPQVRRRCSGRWCGFSIPVTYRFEWAEYGKMAKRRGFGRYMAKRTQIAQKPRFSAKIASFGPPVYNVHQHVLLRSDRSRVRILAQHGRHHVILRVDVIGVMHQ